MCGICGKISLNSQSDVSEGLIRKMCAMLAHRGPDDEGIYVKETRNPRSETRIGLGHRRLSIIDLSSAGHQPMSNENGTIWFVMNGEIYNFLELKEILEKHGHLFKSRSDPEVLIHLYEEKGIDCLGALRGPFAFALWDEKRQILFLARDRIGKKPLYYFFQDTTLIFGSEIKAILQDPIVSVEVNRPAITNYLSYGYIPTPQTMFKNIMKLPPAHFMVYKNGNIKIQKYWELDFSKKVKLSEEEYSRRLLESIEEATKIRLVSDVPIGALLSGGIDSSTVVYMMSKINSGSVKTFSIGFDEKAYSELRYARLIANQFGTEHHEYIVTPDAIELLPKLVWHYNEPYADSSALPSYYVAKMTRQKVRVALNGDGGDEDFGGYERWMAARYAEFIGNTPLPFKKRLIKYIAEKIPESSEFKDFKTRLRRFLLIALKPYRERHYNWVTIFRDYEKDDLFSDEFKKELLGNRNSFSYLNNAFESFNSYDIVDAVMFADIKTNLLDDLLVKMDIATMANSLEGRSPFLDYRLMEFCAAMPSNMKVRGLKLKYIIKKALRGKLPKEILSRGKMGFGVPLDKWFRKELKDYSYDILMSDRCIKRGHFKKDKIKSLLDEHIEGKVNNGAKIWSLLNLELWYRIFIDGERLS
ncbi:MAG: asparagine synthase (glutamine-hydrolyzing) [Candidatus Omnitrophica bacterium]|nr:asparagine synthase (glutamine-hydrolyzing) [Candidatus Omnitrophota bacterium]